MSVHASRAADTVVIGGGSAGAALAGLLAGHSDERVMLIEAGPDYGPRSAGAWPAELLDPTALPSTHDWGYDSGLLLADRQLRYERARVIGGCSSHNGCAAVIGARDDYDAWAQAGNSGWSADDVLPFFGAATARLRLMTYAPEELTPFQAACIASAGAAGIPPIDDFNDLDIDVGMAPAPMNIVDGVRFNCAFAYLDPARARPNLTILDSTIVDRVVLDGDRVTALEAWDADGHRILVHADRIVVCAGAYGTPCVLLRSGIGSDRTLRALGIEPKLDLHGVGENLQDHPTLVLQFLPRETLREASRSFAARHAHPEEQAIARTRSSACEQAFDLHVFPCTERTGPLDWDFQLWVACMDAQSRGSVALTSRDPRERPRIDHALLTDAEGHDARVLWDGVGIARELATSGPLAQLLGEEVDALRRDALGASVRHYWHPAGTAKMGPASDPQAVVDRDGRVHGLANLFVADASVMPTLPRANTHLPTVMIAEKLAARLLGAPGPMPFSASGLPTPPAARPAAT